MSDPERTAAFVSRFLAFVIDVVIVSIVLEAGAWFLGRAGAMLRLTASGWLDPVKSWLSGTLAFLAAAAYFTVAWAAFGRTFGKAFMGLRSASRRRPAVVSAGLARRSGSSAPDLGAAALSRLRLDPV